MISWVNGAFNAVHYFDWRLRATLYTANTLNQYTVVSNAGYQHIAGAAFATNTVTVNGNPADRRGEWFGRELAVANENGPVWQNVSVSSGGVTSNGGFVLPANPQSITYDLDGNMTFDGVWTYEWDGENRLKTMTMVAISGLPNAQRKQLSMAYDSQSRRVMKAVATWSGSSFNTPITNRFVYGGWDLLATLTQDLEVLSAFVWGQDLSGTIQGAGGVGGLLVFKQTGSATPHLACYDGNGNVTALVEGSTTAISARYEYSPFGQALRVSGSVGSVNPVRFSTKQTDQESGLVYYNYRYYESGLGRWTGRDVAQEVGGRNLYAFVINAPISYFDGLGDVVESGQEFVESGQEFMLTVQLGIDIALLVPSTPTGGINPAVCALMVGWFVHGGRYDFATYPNKWYMHQFSVPGMGTLKADQFSNFLAGYAGGYASIRSQNMFYAGAVIGAGKLYDSISNYRHVSDGVSMRYNGLLYGVMEALDE